MSDHLKTLYEEICRTHNGIAEFRAKLLALFPLASGASVFVLIGNKNFAAENIHLLFPIGVFGAMITLGLYFYELRGIQNCAGLISCAKILEKSMIPKELAGFGAFNIKLPSALKGIVGVRGASLIIYSTVLATWAYTANIGFTGSTESQTGGLICSTTVFVFAILFGWIVTDQYKSRLDETIKQHLDKNNPNSEIE